MTTIRELVTLWGFKVDDKAIDAVDKKVRDLGKTVAYVGGVAVAAAATMFGFATTAAEAGAEVKRAAERIGISVEALQGYQYAARLAGQTNAGFQGSLQTLVKNLFDARRGLGASREAFYLLGNVMGKDLLAKGKSAEEILLDVSDGLNLVADPSRKLELAGMLFGGDAGAMLTTLKAGSKGLQELAGEAGALGGIMSKEAADASEHYARELERTKTVALGLRNTLGVALYPVVEKVMSSFRNWVAVNKGWIATRLHESFAILATYIERVLYVTDKLLAGVRLSVAAMGGWNRVLKIASNLFVGFLALKTAALVGQIAMLSASLLTLGIEAIIAAAPVIAVGAAILGLLLIIEDVVAYFQGRKSITGYIVKDFEGLEKKIDEFIGPLLAKVTAFGKKIGAAIVDGIDNINAADLKKVGDFIVKALKLALDLGALPFQIGLAIAEGIMDGLVDSLRKRFPKLSEFLGLNEGQAGGANPLKGLPTPLDATGTKLFGTSFKDVLTGIGSAVSDHFNQGVGGIPVIAAPSAPAGPGPSPAAAAAGMSSSSNVYNITSTQHVNVPAGTPPEAVGKVTTDSIKDSLKSMFRETGRATAPAGSY